ncbi:hypothetical protein EVAR_49366_1 [Eumeta japonica]|uniref:Uncharacterized protein n=1 Tax=Eumeta variegata TaxID=151549 RepID=A0A4C1XWM1_EUMVA|nr:hypothetical protein EVAR_49366_1 [Eumeta japonica]
MNVGSVACRSRVFRNKVQNWNAFPNGRFQKSFRPWAGGRLRAARPPPASVNTSTEDPSPRAPAPSFDDAMPWESSEEAMGGPREMRIHVQRVIAIPAPRRAPAEPLGPYPPPPPPSREQNDESAVVHQFVPQPAPTQEMEHLEGPKMQMDGTPMQAMPMNLPWGLTPEDLQAIHRTAEEAAASHQREQQIDNDMQEVKTIVNTLAAAAEAEAAEEQRRQSSDSEQEPAEAAASARAPRTLLLPQEMPMEERPHLQYFKLDVQPHTLHVCVKGVMGRKHLHNVLVYLLRCRLVRSAAAFGSQRGGRPASREESEEVRLQLRLRRAISRTPFGVFFKQPVHFL